MADVLTFDPTSEFELIGETFEFEEDVQRPEELRFFTLDEQLLDYEAKVLTGKKKPTSFEIKLLKKEVDRLRELYTKTINFVDTEYTVETERKSVNVSWVSPIYSNFSYVPFSYKNNWIPLDDQATRKAPNHYNRLLNALPRPFKTTEKDGIPISESGVFVNEQGEVPIKALGPYSRTKTVIHDDNSMEIVKLPIGNTVDEIKVKGYYIGKRSVDIPNPLSEHPFLSSNEPSKVMTDEPLNEIFPKISAILNHGVPTTTDPYGEGLKYLKIYDVKFSQIPWSIWKVKFPSVDPVVSPPAVISVEFPKRDDEAAPSESIRKTYVLPWSEGINPRLWLMNQEDGGALIVKKLLSMASLSGVVPPEAPGEKLGMPNFETSTPEECIKSDSFDILLNSGVYRSPPWSEVNSAVDKSRPVPLGKCIPVDHIQQERVKFRTAGKIAWKETTETDILKEYVGLLNKFQKSPEKPVVVKYEKYRGLPISELRKDVITLLSDPSRTPQDKAVAIQLIIMQIAPSNNLYLDKAGSFIVCEHTLSDLRGELEEDEVEYFTKWTTIEEGYRMCKFCGEHINTDVLVAQDDFDNDGKVIINYDSLDTQVFHGESHVSSFTNSLAQLRKVFDLKNPGEFTLYTILSLLQVLPDEIQLLPVLQFVRDLSNIVRSRKGDTETKNKTEGYLGICGAVILLQTHNPFLIPRRSFGSKIFKLTGYPRDTVDSSDSHVLNNVIYELKASFEDFPSAFKDSPITPILRAIIGQPKEVRKECVRYLAPFVDKFRVQLESAKERYVEPKVEDGYSNLNLTVIPMKKLEYSPSEKIGTEELMMRCDVPKTHSIFTSKFVPKIVQDPLILDKNIRPAQQATYVDRTPPPTIERFVFDDKEIRRRINIGPPKFLKTDKIDKFLKGNVDGVAILALINRILDIVSVEKFSQKVVSEYRTVSTYLQSRINPSLFRDVTKGLLFEVFDQISKDKNKAGLTKILENALQYDLVLNMILLTRDDAERVTQTLVTKEREKLKQRMRNLNDMERELTKQMLDIGIASYIITNEDREIFAREYNYPDPESEYNELQARLDSDQPEEGYNDTRDYVENGDLPRNQFGGDMEVDYGNYGDRAERPYEDDYTAASGRFDFDEGYGV